MQTKRPLKQSTTPATSPRPPSDGEDRHLSDRLTDSLGFLIVDSGRYVKRSLYARIANHSIRGGAWFVLRVLWQRDGLTQRELASKLGLMEPSVQEMLRAMERDGLVTRQRDAEDRRKVRIRVTERAKQLEPALMGIAEEVNTLMLSGLNAAEEALLKLLLRKVRETLTADADALATLLPEEPVPGTRTARKPNTD
jgi:MarR family transcriptional regulator, organic hydroperoxide resistance regulator